LRKLSSPSQDASYYVGYCYDNLNRMTQATENATDCATNLLATYAYDPQSRRTLVTYGNGATMSYPSYSNAGDLQTLTSHFPVGSNDNSFTYTYTAAHQTLTATASKNTWFWEPSTDSTTAYTVNNLNQYATIGSQTTGGTNCQGQAQGLSYDCNGNLTFDGTRTYTYDAENRLLTANATGLAATYAYDPLGRRTKKSGTGVTTTYYLSDGTDEIAEYDSTKTVTVRYIPGPAIDEPIAMETASTGAKEYFHTDKQGSVSAMSDATGAMVEGPYTYDPYGNCFVGSTPCSSSGEPYRFTGRRFDAETGLYYYRARYYDPVKGRFLQTDPVGYSLDLNLYVYVENEPVDLSDPSGKDCDKDQNNTVNCTERIPGSKIPIHFSFPAPKGWPNHINSNTLHHHLYDVKRITKGGAARAARLTAAEARDPTPGDDKPASPQGTLNDATPGAAAGALHALANQPGFPDTSNDPISPVKSYTDKNGNVFNVTLPGHPLFPGVVAFKNVTNPNGSITMHAIGEGAGILQDPGEPTAAPLDNIWIPHLRGIDESTP